MTPGILQDEMLHLSQVRTLMPNVRHQWQTEENQRSFIEWCQKDEERPLADELKNVDMHKPWTRYVSGLLP